MKDGGKCGVETIGDYARCRSFGGGAIYGLLFNETQRDQTIYERFWIKSLGRCCDVA